MASWKYIIFFVAFAAAAPSLEPTGGEEVSEPTTQKEPADIYKRILNGWISDYLECYEKMKKKESEDDRKTMDIIEKLVIQSWITMVEPDVSLVKPFVPGDESTTTEAINNNIFKSLEAIGQPEVEKRMLYNTYVLHDKLTAKMFAKSAAKSKDVKSVEVNGEVTVKDDEDTIVYAYHTRAVHTLLAPRMYMQSYIFDFIPEPYGPTHVFKYEGKELEVELGNYVQTEEE